jgi:hypothetical protein
VKIDLINPGKTLFLYKKLIPQFSGIILKIMNNSIGVIAELFS